MSFTLDHSLEVLQRTPAVLHSLLHGLSDFWSMSNYGPETFSPFDVVGHLIHADQTDWMVRARIILEHGESQPFPPFDRYAMYEASQGKTMADLLTEFAQEREKSLAELRALKLTPEQLEKHGTHPALGSVALKQLLATWVAHDLNHLHQIAKAMAYQYRNEVGPWREYLTFLPRD